MNKSTYVLDFTDENEDLLINKINNYECVSV